MNRTFCQKKTWYGSNQNRAKLNEINAVAQIAVNMQKDILMTLELSHLRYGTICLAKEKKVAIIKLPAHTTHVL